MKKCSKCQKDLPLDSFYKNKFKEDGLQNYCKPCKADADKRSYCKNKQYAASLARKYGMTVSERDGILFSQDWSCGICGTKDAGGRGKFHVDHNHDTGEVRGLLCKACNTGLDQFGDSIDTLKLAVTYLEEKGSYGH